MAAIITEKGLVKYIGRTIILLEGDKRHVGDVMKNRKGIGMRLMAPSGVGSSEYHFREGDEVMIPALGEENVRARRYLFSA